jgi:hypothetical protein
MEGLYGIVLMVALFSLGEGHICWEHQRAACVSGHNIQLHSDKSVEECKDICAANPQCKSFEYGVPHGGSDTQNKPRFCRPQTSADSTGCPGAHYNSDLYVRQECSGRWSNDILYVCMYVCMHFIDLKFKI